LGHCGLCIPDIGAGIATWQAARTYLYVPNVSMPVLVGEPLGRARELARQAGLVIDSVEEDLHRHTARGGLLAGPGRR
jgi:hypothetical protein